MKPKITLPLSPEQAKQLADIYRTLRTMHAKPKRKTTKRKKGKK